MLTGRPGNRSPGQRASLSLNLQRFHRDPRTAFLHRYARQGRRNANCQMRQSRDPGASATCRSRHLEPPGHRYSASRSVPGIVAEGGNERRRLVPLGPLFPRHNTTESKVIGARADLALASRADDVSRTVLVGAEIGSPAVHSFQLGWFGGIKRRSRT